MAYVTHLKPDGTYQPLKAHEENVAALPENLPKHSTRRRMASERGCCTTSANTATTGRNGSAIRNIRPRWITPRRARSWHGN